LSEHGGTASSTAGGGSLRRGCGEDADPRKLRLFARAVGRHLPRLCGRAEEEEREAAVAVADHFADGLATEEELREMAACSDGFGRWAVSEPSVWEGAYCCVHERLVRAGLKAQPLRCIFGMGK
jgi:hypothetical protein